MEYADLHPTSLKALARTEPRTPAAPTLDRLRVALRSANTQTEENEMKITDSRSYYNEKGDKKLVEATSDGRAYVTNAFHNADELAELARACDLAIEWLNENGPKPK
jgi:hypothetical protein